MSRILCLAYGTATYLIFLATFLYLIAFVGDLALVPRTIDDGPPAPLGTAIITDLALIALFGLQHSVMARPGFKAAWTRVVPKPVERSTYVLFASLALILLFMLWRPIPMILWNIESLAGVAIMWTLFALGWIVVLVSTFLISHFELFGLSQTYLHMRGHEPAEMEFTQPLFYRMVRHPIYAGFFLAFWATPQMTVGHLLFALGMSVYMLIGIRYEEHDLIAHFGTEYEDYRSRVGMLTPKLRRRVH